MRRVFRVLLFLLVQVILGLGLLAVVLEPAIRILRPQDLVMRGEKPFFPGDPDLQFAIRPNAEKVLARRDFRITIHSNALGYRDPDRGPKGGAFRILALGDSFTFGWGVEREDTFEARMERLHADAGTGPPLEVINAGVPGYNLYQSVLALEKKGWKVDPDIVLFGAFVQNDFSANLTTEEWIARKKSGKKKEDKPALAAWLEANSQAWVWLRTRYKSSYRLQRTWYKITRVFKPEKERHRYRSLMVFREPFSEEMKREWRLTEKLLLRLRDDVRARGRRLLIVLFPPELQTKRERWKKDIRKIDLEGSSFDIEKPNKRLAAFCRANGISLLDLLPVFRASVDAGQELYLTSDHHWNAEGHRLAAETILKDLYARGWLPGGGGDSGTGPGSAD